MPKTVTGCDAVSKLLSDRISDLKLKPDELAQTVARGGPDLAEHLLTGEAKIGFSEIPRVCRLLRLEESRLHRLMTQTYLAGAVVGPIERMGENLNRDVTLPIVEDGTDALRHDESLLLPKLRIRQLLVRYPEGFSLSEAATCLLVDEREAEQLLRLLVSYDVVESIRLDDRAEDRWRPAALGNALAKKKVPDPLERQSAAECLIPLFAQVANVNARRDLLFRIGQVVVIGELLTEERIPFVEVELVLEPRQLASEARAVLIQRLLERCWDVCIFSPDAFQDELVDWPCRETQLAMSEVEADLPVAIRWSMRT